MTAIFYNLLSLYFGGLVITVALWVLKPTVFASEEFLTHLQKRIRQESLGPKTYALGQTVFALFNGVGWPYVLWCLIKDGRATKADIKEFDK